MARLNELPLLVVLLGIAALSAWVPAVHAATLGDERVAQGFFYAGFLLTVLTILLALALRDSDRRPAPRGQLAALAGAYVILPPVFALPFLQAVPDTTLANAWFEMLSAFTTTGASAYDPLRLPPSVHLWRALVGWMGGFFILLAAWAILAPLNLGGGEVISGRLPGQVGGQGMRGGDGNARLVRTAQEIFPVYAGLTLALWVGLLVAGETGLDALIHAMGTLSTSGITAQPGGLAGSGAGVPGEVLIALFLIFAVTRQALPVPALRDGSGRLRSDPELRLAALIVLVVPATLLARHFLADSATDDLGSLHDALSAIWGSVFTTLSFLTTTGYESSHWSSARDWSGLGAPGLVLLGLAILGGGAATTAGGVKLLRVHALLRHGERELERIVHPHSVGGQGQDARRLRREGAYFAWIFFMMFAMAIAGTVAALTLLGMGFDRSLVLGIAALTSTGPLAASASPDGIGYLGLTPGVQAVLGLAMIVGRLETLALVAILSPGTWRR